MKNKYIIRSLLFIVILSAILIPRFIQNKPSDNGSNGKGSRAIRNNRPIAVSVQVAKLSPVEEKVVITGTVRASKDIEIRNEISGRVIGTYFKEGMTVKKDQVLIKLNDSELQAQLLKARASLKLAKDKETRQKGLLEKEVISTEEYQNSLKDRESCEADVKLLSAQIEKTRITAPFTGVVGLSSVSEGAFLSTGSKIANLVSVNDLEIESNIAERYATYLRKGMGLTFTLSGKSKIYNGVISAIEPKIDDVTRTVAIKARCVNSDDFLIAGSFVKISIIVNQHNGILVPGNTLLSDIEGYKIYTVQKGQPLQKLVTTGYRDEKNVEILTGLNTGDTIITTGAFMLRPKSKIEIRTAPEEKHQ